MRSFFALAAAATSLVFACSSSDSGTPGTTTTTPPGSDAGPVADGGSVPVADSAPGSNQDITVPATITGATGQQSIVDPAFFKGFAGTHAFGRGSKADNTIDAPSAITDCKLTIDDTTLTLEGGGETVKAPLISTNPNSKTNLIAEPDTFKLGGIELMNFFDQSGAGMDVGITYGVITAVTGNKPGVSIQCGANWASNVTTDRSQDTLTIGDAVRSAITTAAGSGPTYSKSSATASDLGGATGSVVIGRGVRSLGSDAHVVEDCKVDVTGGTITVSGGGFSASDAFTGAASDTVSLVQTPNTKLFAFKPAGGTKVIFQVNAFGFVTKASAHGTDGTLLTCPN